ncbi:hypothetical protein TWF730_009847 [Orbilia blumenaviensis]|uniref:Uncharacterized protein n=1 Tax=Orbilia blumenaviensis TaxID=1796055 RepID=A0AAV9UTR8_9PEZI
MKRKSSNGTEEGQTYWIHPLLRHWAQDSYSDGKSMVLETKKSRLRKLHTNGYLQAISLVGCGLNTRYDKREEIEWNYERRNMTHISLCFDTYIPDCDFVTDEAALNPKVALALSNFSGLKYYWGENEAWAEMSESAVSLYQRLMRTHENPPLELETDMLLANQDLIFVNIFVKRAVDYELLEGTLSRQRELLAPDDPRLLWTESMKASSLYVEGRNEESLEQFKKCLENNAEALDPGHWVSMATINDAAVLCQEIGDMVSAEELYELSAELYLKYRGPNHLETHVALQNVAYFRSTCGNYEGELEYLKILAKGSEETYGLANENTMKALKKLEFWYQEHGQDKEQAEVDIVTLKIEQGRSMLASAED